MGAVGGIAAVIFGIFWTIQASSMGAPGIFPVFGIVFCLVGIAGVIYNLVNATGKNRMSTFDVTRDDEESDPIARALGHEKEPSRKRSRSRFDEEPRKYEGDFCPYCGKPVKSDFDFCPACGKDI